MEFVVATRSFLAHVTLGPSWELRGFEVLATGRHYGIALPGDDGNRFRAMSKWDDTLTTYERNPEGRFEAVDTCHLNGQFDDTHQVALWGTGVFVANSGYNSLDFVCLEGGDCHRLLFDEHGSRHVNSVYPCGPEHAVAMLHNKGSKNSEVAVVRHDPVTGLQLATRVSLWDTGCHNVYVDDQRLVYNASEVGDFVVVDVRDGRPIRRIHFPGHTKGLSVTRDHYVIGVSEYASRWARATSRGRLVAIDRHTLEVVADIDVNHPSLPHPVGNINEIRCLTEEEGSHGRTDPLGFDLEAIHFQEPRLPEQVRMRARRTAITALKTAKTLWISARERGRRLLQPELGGPGSQP